MKFEQWYNSEGQALLGQLGLEDLLSAAYRAGAQEYKTRAEACWYLSGRLARELELRTGKCSTCGGRGWVSSSDLSTKKPSATACPTCFSVKRLISEYHAS